MTKKIVKRTDANNETLYFYTHSDAVDVGEGSSTKSLTEVIDDTLHKSAQTLTNAEKTQVYANLGLNGVDNVPTENSNNIVRSGGVKAAIDDVIDDFTNRGFMYKGIAPASAPLGEDKTFYIAKSGDYTAYTGIGDGSFTLNGIAVLTYATATTSGAWTKNDIVLFDEEPTAESENLVKSGGVQNELALGAVYDVSAKNPTAGPNNDGKFESLSALLSDNNLNTLIPTSVRKGGMSIKFVQSSDNKYVQFRCMADEFTTDTTQWAIAEEGVYVENPEFIEVTTDKDNMVLWGVRTDGTFYFGAGCPPQVKEYLESKISELQLTSVPDILTFLGNIEETTLADLLADKVSISYLEAALALKVDKVEGKNLIDENVAENVEFVENSEFIDVTTDNEGKIVSSYDKDGTFVPYCGINVREKINIDDKAKNSLFVESFIQDLSFINGYIGKNGDFGPKGSLAYITSKRFQVYKGDKLIISAYGVNNLCILAKTFDTPDFQTNYTGISYTPILVASATGQTEVEYIVPTTCKLVVCSVEGHETRVVIYRNYLPKIVKLIEEESRVNHPFVTDLDFVPNLAKKKTNSILTYSGDTKVSQNFIANAVAYPNGEIIATRDGGDVVKISNDGSETLLMTIPNTHDWRGVFIDSNLNVYVSPHSTNTTPAVSQSDRGLYRLAYGSNTFEKVISLYYSSEQCGVDISLYSRVSSFVSGSLYFYDTDGYLYICTESHVKGNTFESDKFSLIDTDWIQNTAYSLSDIVVYNDNYFVCIEAHTSRNSFSYDKWLPVMACMQNDDTIWTMCEDDKGNLYAGVYAHSVRRNPAVYVSTDNGETWNYKYNFFNGASNRNSAIRHVHCINFNEFNNTLYAAVGEVNTLFMSSDHNESWVNLNIPMYYGQPTMLIGVKDGTLIGSDGHYACGVTKLLSDNKTIVNCGCTTPGFIFAMRRSDLTGWIYTFTRCDNVTGLLTECPPMEAIDDVSALESWKQNDADDTWLIRWESYNKWASKYYPEDAIRPTHAVIMVSKDEGESWVVIRYEQSNSNFASVCGFITTGYFRNGECLTGLLKSVQSTHRDMSFVNPIIISEGKKKIIENGYDLSGEIFIKTNNSNTIKI